MVGTKTTGSNYFRGIFDGDGHTLTFNCTAANDYAAPFRFVANATMGDFIYAINNGGDWAGTETRALTIQVTNQHLSAAKGLFKAFGTEQLARL